jgi:hypothetical protein
MINNNNFYPPVVTEKSDSKKTQFSIIALLLLLCFYFLQVDKMIPDFHAFLTIFMSVILEAVPFLLIGTLVYSVINSFVTPDFIARHLPKNMLLAIIGASLFGLVFPICECAIIPVVRRLIKKGLPLYRQNGYPIWSGLVEVSCKLVIKKRFKGNEIRWRKRDNNSVLRVRLSILNN